jgi:hypothetical protein
MGLSQRFQVDLIKNFIKRLGRPMEKARIYQGTKTAMQSGKRKTKTWILEFPQSQTGLDPLMGWLSTKSVDYEVKLTFSSGEEAESYAKDHNIEYVLEKPPVYNMIPQSYGQNFPKRSIQRKTSQ